ncbi:hypothetical protein OIU79_015838 [Salix purpurea]|uniref:NB-ARC domain-containing protein n=1 Tax=Salix purpurea TaxID=77065 RepID=A0A9Q0SQP7_SALPP|nr:hypothetical protein OIU79_015838 [Salix purpurea]
MIKTLEEVMVPLNRVLQRNIKQSVNEESTSHGQDADSAGPSISDEQKISSTTGQSNSDEQPANKFLTPMGRGPTNSNEHVRSDDQRVHEGQPAHAVDSNNLEAIAKCSRWTVNADSRTKYCIRQKTGANQIVQSFQYRAWVHVSKEFSEKDLLIDMLKQVTTIKDEEKLLLEKLQERVRDVLISRRCLIVLDDVQTSDVQNLLKNTFINSLNGSRVILTVRDRKIIDAIGAEGKFSLELRRLTSPESLELFSKRVRTDNRSEIPKMEQIIDKKCQGLPLAIVVLAGLLSTKEPSSWSTVIKRIDFRKDPSKAVLTLAYQDLPPDLKPCLLYLGLFPKDYEIPIRRLFRLWEAEGLVKCSNQGSPEEVSPEKYFEDLVKRNMIEVAKVEVRWKSYNKPCSRNSI